MSSDQTPRYQHSADDTTEQKDDKTLFRPADYEKGKPAPIEKIIVESPSKPVVAPEDNNTLLNLPTNPLALRSFKYNCIKSRVQKMRFLNTGRTMVKIQSSNACLPPQKSPYIESQKLIRKNLATQQQ